MSYPLKLRFPKQTQDYKLGNRTVRQNALFKEFVTGKSKDLREVYLEFPEKEQFETLSLLLVKTLEEVGYVVEVIE